MAIFLLIVSSLGAYVMFNSDISDARNADGSVIDARIMLWVLVIAGLICSGIMLIGVALSWILDGKEVN